MKVNNRGLFIIEPFLKHAFLEVSFFFRIVLKKRHNT